MRILLSLSVLSTLILTISCIRFNPFRAVFVAEQFLRSSGFQVGDECGYTVADMVAAAAGSQHELIDSDIGSGSGADEQTNEEVVVDCGGGGLTCVTTMLGNKCMQESVAKLAFCANDESCHGSKKCFTFGQVTLGYCGGCSTDEHCPNPKATCFKTPDGVGGLTDNGRCVARSVISMECNGDSDCATNEFCSSLAPQIAVSKCRQLRRNSAGCRSNAQCISGWCSNNRCSPQI